MVMQEHYHELKLPKNFNLFYNITQLVVHNPKNKNIFICNGIKKHDVNIGIAYANASNG